MLNFKIERLKRLPQRMDEVWQGGLLRMPSWVVGEEGQPYRPLLPIWAAVKANKIHSGGLCRPEACDPDKVLDALVGFGTESDVGGYRPGRVEVRDPALAEYLKGSLSETGIDVVQRDALPALDRVLAAMAEGMAGEPLSPGALKGKGVTVERMQRFSDAAKAFYEAAPWNHLTDEDLVTIESPRPPQCLQYATVLGAAGQTYGMGFHDRPESVWEIRRTEDFDAWFASRKQAMWNLTFGPMSELPIDDADLWEDHDLPVACGKAYPCALGHGPREGVMRPDAKQLAFLEGLLRALAKTTEGQIDSGRWTVGVETADGPVDVTLALPDLLDPPDYREWMHRGFDPDRRAMERMHAQMDRFLEEQQVEDLDAVNELIQREFVGKEPDPSRYPPRNALEEARNLCYQACDTHWRGRLQLARKALEVCGDCADAHVLLAEHATGPDEALEHYAEGVAAGERALGKARFDEEVGHFWGVIDTRPYMRARFGLAQCHERLGQLDEAVDNYRELLRLNPGDNQGVRYLYLPCLLRLGRDAEAARFMKKSDDEPTANWAYTRAVLAYRLGGDCSAANDELAKAVKTNPHVVDCLLSDDRPPIMPESYGIGSLEEAVIAAEELRPVFAQAPGAREWLEARGRIRSRLHRSQRTKKRRRKRR